MIARMSNRRGYALLLVVLFDVLFLLLLGVVWRHLESAIRTATFRTEQTLCDEGRLRALAQAMQLLETGLPPISPYQRGAIIVLDASGEERFYNVAFVRDDTLPPADRKYWTVTATRTSTRPTETLPSYFPTATP
jgi:hypothetical protein